MGEIDPVFERFGEAGLAAVVVLEDESMAVPVARALVRGGVRAMEVTLRSDAALGALARIAAEVPQILLGAGTILRADQVHAARESGAMFGVSPGTSPAVVKEAAAAGLPFAPGIATPSEVETALSLGCRVLKFFPADGMGGLPYLRNMAAPYRHLGLRYIPLGGVNESNLADYAAAPDVLAVGGSWLAPRAMIASGDWEGIERLAAAAVKMISAARGQA